MAWPQRTYRIVDGARIEGTWRPVFIRNGDTYHLTDLLIYADGKVDCWGLAGFEEFCAKVRSGWVATQIVPGARASAFMAASWRMADPVSWVTADQLIAEVSDEITRLRGQPTSEDLCMAALRSYLAEPAAERLEELRAAYLAVHGHLRIFLLGDMDARDVPLRRLLTPAGEPLLGTEERPRGPVVTDADQQDALAYFAERSRLTAPAERARWNDPERPAVPRDVVRFATGVRMEGADPDSEWLSPASPHPVSVGGVRWPTVLHAYWAASTGDRELVAAIGSCGTAHELFLLVQDAPRRDRWPQIRVAEMARLLRLKFGQHPLLAARLVATGDSILQASAAVGTDFWDDRGQNWIGRLLELIRAELILNDTPPPGTPDAAPDPGR